MFKLRNVVIAIAVIAVIGFGINAFAHGVRGWGGGWDHHGPGWRHGGGYGMGWHHRDWYDQDYEGRPSKEEYKQLEQKREVFLYETEKLRTDLFNKERELQKELAKAEPDAAKATELQKEISGLQSEFDQERIKHMIEMRKLNPNAGRGYKYGGRMRGDYRSPRGGYCWR